MEPIATPALSHHEYRYELERQLAKCIIERDEMIVGGVEEHVADLLKWEINGLCTAMRWLGGYGRTIFNRDWANAINADRGLTSPYGTDYIEFPGGAIDPCDTSPRQIDWSECGSGISDLHKAMCQKRVDNAHSRKVEAMAAHKARHAVMAWKADPTMKLPIQALSAHFSQRSDHDHST